MRSGSRSCGAPVRSPTWSRGCWSERDRCRRSARNGGVRPSCPARNPLRERRHTRSKRSLPTRCDWFHPASPSPVGARRQAEAASRSAAQYSGERVPAAVAMTEHQPDEQAGGRAAPAVVGFDLVGVAAAVVVDGFESQAVIPGTDWSAVFVGEDFGGIQLLDGEVVGPCRGSLRTARIVLSLGCRRRPDPARPSDRRAVSDPGRTS